MHGYRHWAECAGVTIFLMYCCMTAHAKKNKRQISSLSQLSVVPLTASGTPDKSSSSSADNHPVRISQSNSGSSQRHTTSPPANQKTEAQSGLGIDKGQFQSEEDLQKRRSAILQASIEDLDKIARSEQKTVDSLVQEFQAISNKDLKAAIDDRLNGIGRAKRRAGIFVTSGLLPRGSNFGAFEINTALEVAGFKWPTEHSGPVDVESRIGARMLLLPIANANVGVYFNVEFGIPFPNLESYFPSIFDGGDGKKTVTAQELQGLRLISSHLDLSGGIHTRILAYGSGEYWRGLFGSIGYRGSVWGGGDKGIEAGFGLEVWRIRAGATWFHSLSGPVKDLGGQMWGVKLEWRCFSEFKDNKGF